VLDVQADQADYFTEEDATVMGILAGQIAVSIQNARSFESVQRISAESERRARELETVAQVSTTTSTLLDVDELLKQVSDVTKDAFDLYHAHIYLFDEENEMLQLAAGAGEAGDLMKANDHRIPLRHDSSVVAQAARDRRGVRVNDVTASPTFLPNPILPSTRAEMALPMIVGDELVGVLDVQSERIGRFGEEDVVIKSTLAAQVAVAVQNARAYKEQQAVAERLREVDLLKNQFLASMSHELRTPLNSIIGYSEVLLDGGDGELNEDAQEDVEIIYTSGKHLLAIINDILDLAKIEANQMKLHKEPIDVVKILHDVIKTNEVLIGDRPIDLCFESEVDELIVPVDELRIRQVVMNLFSNAAKFTEEGSITIELHMEDDETASIAVTDTGIGIDPEGMEIVFDQFRQVDGTSTRKAGGTGLGLTITRHLVQMHGGEIYVDSAMGEGSKFWFTLPLIEREPEQEMQTA
jgi:signal transduction histidine kinase